MRADYWPRIYGYVIMYITMDVTDSVFLQLIVTNLEESIMHDSKEMAMVMMMPNSVERKR